MDSNTCSLRYRGRPPGGPPDAPPDGLAALAADLNELAAQDPTALADATRGERILEFRRLLDRLEGCWLSELAAVDARGAAGADQGTPAPSTTSWLRNRLRMSASAATSAVRTARALFRGPLTETAQALCDGDISVAHASALAHGTRDLPDQVAAEAEPVLLEAARRMDPPRLRRVVDHLRQVADPDDADRDTERRHNQRWLWLAPTLEGMVAVDGLLEPEAGQILLAALEPLARPSDADDTRSGGQRRADALTELARRNLEGGRLPQTGGVRPQLTVVVDLDSLLGQPGAVGGDAGWAGPLAPEACRRLACDGALTRVLVTRQPTQHHGPHPEDDPQGEHSLAARLQTAMNLLPPVLGGAASQPLDVGRASRVVTPAQRSALAVRDGGCVPRLRPATFLVRGPSPDPLAGWRPHRPGQSGPGLPAASPGAARGRLAADSRTRWGVHRDPVPSAASTTSHRSLNQLHGRSTAGLLRVPAHRAGRLHGARTTPATMPGECMGPEPTRHGTRG